ncbi:MAG: TlpA family protein disulfide reductase [Planctomycetes bacterium]|nr:TlpA family protein disulfide reductase [Planctomycetota bacterium]
MIPHERSLVEKWKDKPFALVGVNSDGTETEAGLKQWRENAKKHGVTWRSFRDEGSTPKISDTWRVQGWPTLYYIDHEGVIRHKDVRDEAEMEKVLEEMIAKAEAAAKGGKPAGQKPADKKPADKKPADQKK